MTADDKTAAEHAAEERTRPTTPGLYAVVSMTITDQARADAMEMIRDLIPRYEAELAIIDALDQHRPLWDQSLNLGYYRTFVECSCGTGIWYGDHQGDPAWIDRWALHRATVIREAVGRISHDARQGDGDAR